MSTVRLDDRHEITVSSGSPALQWWGRKQRKIAPYLFISPFYILFGVFFIFPVFYALALSLHKMTGFSTPTFIGLSNYATAFDDPRLLQALINTTFFALGSVFIQLPISFGLALAFNSSSTRRLDSIYRVGYFFPVLASTVVVALMFTLVFNKDYGIANSALRLLGFAPIPWLSSRAWAMPSVILLGVWIWAGVNSFYLLAGLKGIPEELHEAAAIDGANGWQTFLNITVPMLRPVILFVTTAAIIGSYSLFAQPLILTGGGPGDASLTMVMYIYFQGFRYVQMGYASALGYILALLIFILSLLQLRLFGMSGVGD